MSEAARETAEAGHAHRAQKDVDRLGECLDAHAEQEPAEDDGQDLQGKGNGGAKL